MELTKLLPQAPCSWVGGLLAPECVNDAVGRDDFIAVQQQEEEQRSLLGSGHGEFVTADPYLQRSEHRKAHPRLTFLRSMNSIEPTLTWAKHQVSLPHLVHGKGIRPGR